MGISQGHGIWTIIVSKYEIVLKCHLRLLAIILDYKFNLPLIIIILSINFNIIILSGLADNYVEE